MSDNNRTSWAFDSDINQKDPVYPWAYWNEAFTKDECQSIIDIGESSIEKVGPIKADTAKNNYNNIRESDITWLFPSSNTEWVYNRISNIIVDLNKQFFMFNLYGMIEGLQFTKYTAPGGKYGKHIDKWSNGLIRKLSFTLQLSDPKDYEGGELRLYYDEDPVKINKHQGYVCCFPSYTLHEVTPVTKGTRYSLVSWVTGKPFR